MALCLSNTTRNPSRSSSYFSVDTNKTPPGLIALGPLLFVVSVEFRMITPIQNHRVPVLNRLRLARFAPLLVALSAACQAAEAPTPYDEVAVEIPRDADPSEPCVHYCDARSGTFMDRCMAAQEDDAQCQDAWEAAFDSCVASQCTLVVQVPESAGLEALALELSGTLLGPEFDLVASTPHYWGIDEIGSHVYTFTSSEDGSPAFIELGASLEQPPIVSHGFGPVAAEALVEHAAERLTEAYGALGYTLTRRYFTAAHPILEFQTPQGDSFFYSVATDDISDTLGIEDDPDADLDELALRREGFVREWNRYL